MNALLDSFLDYISLERGLSLNTRKAYADDIGQFLDELTRKGVSSLSQVSRKQVLDHLLGMKSRNMSTNSISRHLVAIKVFFRYLQQEGLMDRNVTDTMDSPKLWKILPDTLSIDIMIDPNAMSNRRSLSFEIRGVLWTQSIPESMFIKTELDLETGKAGVNWGGSG